MTDLSPGTAGGTIVVVAGAMVVLVATNGLSATMTGWATAVAQTFVMGGITDTLICRWRTGSEDRDAEVGTGAVVGLCQTGKQSGQDRATQDVSDTPKGLATGGPGGNGFGERIKLFRVHGRSLLSLNKRSTSACRVGTQNQETATTGRAGSASGWGTDVTTLLYAAWQYSPVYERISGHGSR